MDIGHVLAQQQGRDLPTIPAEATIDDVIRVMVRSPHTRLAYVVDEGGRLVGTITVGSLLRHLYPHHYEGKVHGSGILRGITAAVARNVMDRERVSASPREDVEAVLERMAATGVKEMAVVDAEGRVVGDVTAIDLLRHYHVGEAGGREDGGAPGG